MLLSKQSSLARLPVPSLDATLTKLVRTLEPLADASEVARVAALANDFMRTVGPQLQQLLIERDRSEPNSWLETWWNELAYLRYRECVPINVSFAMPFLATPAPLVEAPVRRAALLCRALLEYKQLIDTRALPMDPQPSDQLPHTRIFGACRVPQPECDAQIRYAPAVTNHIVVVWRDAFWRVGANAAAAAMAADDVPSVAQLEAALQVVHSSPVAANVPRVGALTYANRDAWATAHAELLRDGNEVVLDAIQSAAFVLCLDSARPATLDAHAAAVLHADSGTCSNRWFDKPVQLIVFANGRAGICGEHSPVDGEPVSRLSDWVCAREQELLVGATAPPVGALLVEPLVWKLSERSLGHVRDAVAFAARQIAGVRVHQLVFGDYGKEAITKLGVSPDAWVQAAMQLAYHRKHGRLTPTYESASTRRHLAGRTETGRTLTPELARFVLAMHQGDSAASCQALLVTATKAHVAYMREAGAGHGVDRHMLAMRVLAAQSGVSHALLSDPLLASSAHWRLSTSQLLVKHVAIGFGPVVADGYGVCYQIHKSHLHFSVSSFVNEHGTDAFSFADHIRGALRDMFKLFPAQQAAL